MKTTRTYIQLAVCTLLFACLAHARVTLGQPSGQTPDVFKGVAMDEQLGSTVPGDVFFVDENGKRVELGQFLDGKKPVLINFVYHNCPMLCNLVMGGMADAFKKMDWVPGKQFEVVTVSFAPNEGPELAEKQKKHYLGVVGKPEAAAGWHFLTGTEPQIQKLARAIGFEFKYIEEKKEYAHPAAIIFLSGNGKITRYLYGVEFPPRNMRAALVEASQGKVGTPIDQVFLFCFHYDPKANSYVLSAINVMKAGGLLTLLALGSVLLVFWRRERRMSINSEQASGAAPAPSVGP
ncbi:MAG TPA: SCO family protein [Rhodothermales bacterium]|nr:SCO family protein [Rhodothermales bacterium]